MLNCLRQTNPLRFERRFWNVETILQVDSVRVADFTGSYPAITSKALICWAKRNLRLVFPLT
jgi:hypothetical protein